MVVMLVAVEKDPDVAELEPQLADTVGDKVRARRLRSGVDQYVAVRAGDQDGADAARADEIGVAVDAHRRCGVVPSILAGAGLREGGSGFFDRGNRPLDVARRLPEWNRNLREEQRREESGTEASEHSWRH